MLAKLSMLLIGNKAEFNLPSHTLMNVNPHTQQKSDHKGYIDAYGVFKKVSQV